VNRATHEQSLAKRLEAIPTGRSVSRDEQIGANKLVQTNEYRVDLDDADHSLKRHQPPRRSSVLSNVQLGQFSAS